MEEPIIFNLLPKKFSLRELQSVYEAILGSKLDRRNFRKKIFLTDWLIDLNEFETDVTHRPGKLYAFNFGLDLAYIAAGFFLREKGVNETNLKSQDQLKGYGSSIILQGGFLLLMDGVMIWVHHKNSVRLNNKLRGLDLAMGPGGLGLRYSF